MKRIISLFLAICIFASAFPLTAFADSKEIITTEPINVRFVCSTDNGNAVSNTVQLDFQICDGTVMGNLKDLCAALGLEYSRVDNNGAKEKIEQLQRIPDNDYARREIRLLRESLNSDGAVVRKDIWGEHAFISFIVGQKHATLTFSTCGDVEISLPEKIYIDKSSDEIYVPLDMFLFIFDCEYYVGNDSTLVIKEPKLTINDIANSSYIFNGDHYYVIYNKVQDYGQHLFPDAYGVWELFRTRYIQYVDDVFSLNVISAYENITSNGYDEKYGEALAVLLCSADEREMQSKYDTVCNQYALNDLFGLTDSMFSSFSEEDLEKLGIDATDITIDDCEKTYKELDSRIKNGECYSYFGGEGGFSQLLSNITAVVGDGYGKAFDQIKEKSKSLSVDMSGELTAVGVGQYILSPIAGTLCDWASIISEYANISPESTKAVASFFDLPVVQQHKEILPSAMYSGIINEIGICTECNGESILPLSEKLSKTLAENMVSSGVSLALKDIPVLGLVSEIWNLAKIGDIQKALDAADSFQTSSYSVKLQTLSYHALCGSLMGCSSEEEQKNLGNVLTFSLKSGYIARTEAIEYLNKTIELQDNANIANRIEMQEPFDRPYEDISLDSYKKGVSGLEKECEEIADMIAVLEYSECSKLIDGSVRGKRLLLQDDYNEYLISKLFPDLLPPDDNQSSDDLPTYIVFTRSEKTAGSKTPTEKLIRYNLTTGDELVFAEFGTSYWDEGWNENPTELVGGIDGIQLSDDEVYFYSVGIDGIAVYGVYAVNINGGETYPVNTNHYGWEGNSYYFYGGFEVHDDIMYFVDSEDFEERRLYARVSDNETIECVKNTGRLFHIDDGLICYVSDANSELICTKLDGSNPVIIDHNVSQYSDFSFNNGLLAYITDGTVHVCDVTEDKNITTLYETKVDGEESYGSVIYGDVIYANKDCAIILNSHYDDAKQRSTQSVWRADSTGKYREIDIPAFQPGSIKVYNDWLYFVNEKDEKLYRTRFDGSNIQQITDFEISSDFELYFGSSESTDSDSEGSDSTNSNTQEIVDNLVSTGPWSASGALRQVGSYEIEVEFSENGNVEYSLYDTNQNRYLMDTYYGKYSVEQVDHASDDYVVLLELNETQSGSGITKSCTLSITYLYHVGNLGAHLSYEGCYNPDDISPGWPIEYYAEITLSPQK